MGKKKKFLVAGALVAGLLGGAGLSYKTPSADAKMVGDSPAACEASCSTSAGCFCNRSCILFYCWGNYYCQCPSE